MSSSPGSQGDQPKPAGDPKQTSSPGDATATTTAGGGVSNNPADAPTNQRHSGGGGGGDDDKNKNNKADDDDDFESDDAVDDSEDLDEETVNVRKTSSFYRRRQSMSDTRLQDVLGFPFRPNVRPLTISDLESCVALENAAFSPEHAASKEKFEYRLAACPELCLGLFCTVVPSVAEKHGFEIETLKTAKPAETGRADGGLSVLVAHIVSTRCRGDLVTDESMDYPKDFRTNKASASPLGHQQIGHTIALHSLAVHPKLHGCGLGKLIVKAYLQQVKGASLADRVSLICQDYLVNYYAKHGFKKVGPSPATFGGGGWFDMTIEIGNGTGK